MHIEGPLWLSAFLAHGRGIAAATIAELRSVNSVELELTTVFCEKTGMIQLLPLAGVQPDRPNCRSFLRKVPRLIPRIAAARHWLPEE